MIWRLTALCDILRMIVANTVTNPTLSETVALLIDGWDNMCLEERAVLTALLCVNSSDVRHEP
jgi:hypothetical protein